MFVHFQAMEHATVSRLVAQYQTELPCFSDELHGTAAVVLAGVLGALPSMQGSLGQQTIIISGTPDCTCPRYVAACVCGCAGHAVIL